MTDHNIDPKLLDRIRKCLALSTSSEPEEAARALEMAQRMMAEHGITAEGLSEQEREEVSEQCLRSVASASRVKDWELRLYDAIASSFGCALLFQRGMKPATVKARGLPDHMRYARYIFVGVETEAKMCHYAAVVLQRQLNGARARFTRSLASRALEGRDLSKTRDVDAYCNGWVVGATTKLRSLREAKMSAAREQDARRPAGQLPGQQCTALVVQRTEEKKDQAIQQYVKQVSSGYTPKMNSRGGGSSDAYAQGFISGLAAHIEKPLTGSVPTNSPQLKE